MAATHRRRCVAWRIPAVPNPPPPPRPPSPSPLPPPSPAAPSPPPCRQGGGMPGPPAPRPPHAGEGGKGTGRSVAHPQPPPPCGRVLLGGGALDGPTSLHGPKVGGARQNSGLKMRWRGGCVVPPGRPIFSPLRIPWDEALAWPRRPFALALSRPDTRAALSSTSCSVVHATHAEISDACLCWRVVPRPAAGHPPLQHAPRGG